MVLKKDTIITTYYYMYIVYLNKAVCICVRCVRFTHNIFYVKSEAC